MAWRTFGDKPIPESVCRTIDNGTPNKSLEKMGLALEDEKNGNHFPYDIFKRIFLNGYALITTNISLNLVHYIQVEYNPALVHIIAWCRPGDEPLSEAMVVTLPMHKCVNRPQWNGTKKDNNQQAQSDFINKLVFHMFNRLGKYNV